MSPSRQPRRILMTADTIGGVWTYALELARGLERLGIDTMLATMGRLPTPAQRAQARSIRTVQLFESGFKLEWMEEPWAEVARAGEWLLDLEQRLRPDLVHLNGYVHGALSFRSPKLVVGHSCVLSWWRAVHGTEAPGQWARYAEAVTEGLKCADLVVAPSRTMLQCLETHYGKLHNCRVIHNGRRLPTLTSNRKQPYVLAAGRIWDKAKNISALTGIAPRLAWPVFVAGEGNVQSAGLANVRHLGCLSHQEMAEYVSCASIYALPAHYEPFGLSALEAGLAGCALVLGNIPSLRELWGDAALFVSPDSGEELGAAISELIDDADLRWAMSQRALQAATRFTPEAMVEGYVDAYSSLLSKKPARSQPEALAV